MATSLSRPPCSSTSRLLDDLREDVVRLRVGVGQAVIREHGELHDRLRVHVALDDDGRVGLVGQLVGDSLDLLARVDGRRVGIRREVELERHARPLIARRRGDLLDARHRGQRVLDRLDDLLLHRLRARARVLDRDGHIRRVERRQELHAYAVVAVEAEHDKERDDHRDADRSLDGKACHIHDALASLASSSPSYGSVSTFLPSCSLS